MKPSLLIIDNHDSFTYNLVQIIKESGLCRYKVCKNDEIFVTEAKGYDKILFSPGPGVPDNAPLMYSLINEYKAAKSILGVCLGHQAIAAYFGASLINLKTSYHGIINNVTVTENDEILFRNLPRRFKAGLYHSWAVNAGALPSELRVTAVSDDNIIMSLRHEIYDIRGTQFHPESYMTKYGATIINNWLAY